MQRSNHARAETGSGLDQGELRLVRWLERYPFQRAQDLVVALSPWEGRGSVYRRIAHLQERQLLESLRLGASTRERLYHLSPVGKHVCGAWHPENGRLERVTSLVLRDEREKLVRLLPRLPVWLVIQDLINDLVRDAARSLARVGTGEKASQVCWNWMRDYTQRFVARGQPERVLRVRADGALTLGLRFGLALTAMQEEWRTFLLFSSSLDDGRLMGYRLDRLLRWRESAERTSISSQMPPVLILATTPRQADYWQQAVARVSARLHLDAPLGAVAILPENGYREHSWRLAWRGLGTNTSCHLQELGQATTAPALPELVEAPGTWIVDGREADLVAPIPSYTGKHSYELAATARKALTLARTRPAREVDDRLVSVFLVPRHWDLLALCFAHPLLACDELSTLLDLHEKSVQMLLTDFAHKRLLVRSETVCGGRWQLAEAGLCLLAHQAACHVHRWVSLPVTPGVPLQQRGVAGLLHQIRHTAGIYGFFVTLVRSLCGHAGTRLRWWETGARCEQIFIYREQTSHFKPDALACVQLGARELRFWLEWDRGTMGVRDLERKCATYAAYLASREWASGGVAPPALLYVAPEIAQERRFIRTATALLAHLPGLHLYTTTASLIATQGMLTPIWQPVLWQTPPFAPASPITAPEGSSPPGGQRVALFTEA